jgi:hypothetical protein
MLISEELIWGIEQYGRWNIQEFVARSRDIGDVLTYLKAERILEMVKVMSFVTIDSVSFERRTSLPSIHLSPMRSEGKANTGSNQFKDQAPLISKIHLLEV